MFKTIRPLVIDTVKPNYVGLLTIDIDQAAERFMVLHRQTCELLHGGIPSVPAVDNIILPMAYTTSNELLVLIFDDGGEYNAAAIDGVRLEVVDLKTVEI